MAIFIRNGTVISEKIKTKQRNGINVKIRFISFIPFYHYQVVLNIFFEEVKLYARSTENYKMNEYIIERHSVLY